MAEKGAHTLVRLLSAAIAAKWAVDATFLDRGTRIFSPRIRDLPDDTNVEIVDLQLPTIQFVERFSVAPHYEIRRATLQVAAIVDSAATIDPLLTDPATALLDTLAPLAELVEAKIEIAVREIRSDKATYPDLSNQIHAFDFESYETVVDTEGNRLRAAGVFRYTADLRVPHSFDTDALDDLFGGDVDWSHLDDSVDPPVKYPDEPHAEDDLTLP